MVIRLFLALLLVIFSCAADAQHRGGASPPGPGGTQLTVGVTPINNGSNGNCLTISGTVLGQGGCGGGSSTITAGTTPTSGFTNGHFVGSNGTVTVDQTAVTSVSGGCGTTASPSPIVGTGSLFASLTLRSNTAATDTIISTDCGNVIYENRATAVAVAIAQAGTAGFLTGSFFQVCNINAGVATITPTTSTIGGASSYALAAGSAAAPSCIAFQSDGTNYNLITGTPLGYTQTIASGTAALGTGAINSATCASAVIVSATNVATTDTVTASFNGDPTAVTGYIPATAGMLTIIGYPTSGNVNFKVCNNTSSTVTPGAITLNWRVTR